MKPLVLFLIVVLIAIYCLGVVGKSTKQAGKETWGYVKVRPGASMFYWLYYTTGTKDYTKRPWVIWLAGGPGQSSTGFGNFQEIGPLNMSLKKRKYSWVSEANILFIDSPVGTGFSYVNSTKLLATTNAKIASDLVKMTANFLKQFPAFQIIPLYIFGESYGGKAAPEFASQLHKKIKQGKIICNLKGVNMGDPAISLIDSTLNYAPYLYATSIIDGNGFSKVNTIAYKVKAAFDKEMFTPAKNLWDETSNLILKLTNGVSWWNILKPNTPPIMTRGAISKGDNFPKNYMTKARSLTFVQSSQILSDLMNGPIRKKLQIIPENVIWMFQNAAVNTALTEDFLKPAIHTVEMLLNKTTIAVNIYNGQLDYSTSTMGALQWIEDMNWVGITRWKKAPRKAISLNNETAMFVKTYKKFGFYWILKTGHAMPQDAPQTAIRLLQLVTNL